MPSYQFIQTSPGRSALCCISICAALLAGRAASGQDRIHQLLEELGPDVRRYDSHISTLANPFLEGRLPGTRGMEIAKEYMEYWFTRGGLQPGFQTADGKPSWRQPFLLGQRKTVVRKAALSCGDLVLNAGTDYVVTGLGGSGEVASKLVFCGYGIEEGENGYSSFGETTDLRGNIAVVLRFEPMNANGESLWGEGGWSPRSGLQAKLRALSKRGAKAIVLINTPGARDPRVAKLYPSGGGGSRAVGIPVLQIGPKAAQSLIAEAGGNLSDLIASANEKTTIVELGDAAVEAEVVRERLTGENVGAVVRGRGALADEWVIVGAHLDHLGYGNFGSRRGAGELHAGADDNASGAAGILMIGAKLVERLQSIPSDMPMRNVLFLAFSGEESGLVGSRHYVKEPVAPLDKHALMINFDMIGRMKNERLAVYGHESAKGMADWLEPIFASSGLNVVKNPTAFGGSDHLPFMGKRVPYLFSIIADFHDDYHTPDDVSWKIDRVGAVKAVHMYAKIVEAAAFRPEPFEWQGSVRRRTRGVPPQNARPSRSAIKVRFGIKPGSYTENEVGVLVDGVTPGTTAAKAGLKEGDRILSWNGAKVGDVRDWMGKLMKHKPGDKVKVGIERDGEKIVLDATLEAPAGGR